MSIAGGAGALLIGLMCTTLAAVGASVTPPAAQPASPARGPGSGISIPPASAAPPLTAMAGPSGPSRGTQTATVSGTLTAQDGRQLVSGMVILRNIDNERAAPAPAEDVTIRPDGTFQFRNVPPGRYEIRARGETGTDGMPLFAIYRVIVDGRDLDNVNLALAAGATLNGTVIVERRQAAKPPALAGIRVRAPLADGSRFGDAVNSQVGPDGAFSIRGVVPGSHVVRLEGLPEPWVLKSVVVRGRDVTDTGLEADHRKQLADVRVTIADVTTDVSGTVRDGRGNASAGAVVLLVPLSPQFWTRSSRRLAVHRTDTEGRYRIRGLPAGEYRAIASTELDASDVHHRDLLARIVAAGVPIALAADEIRTLDLSLTPIEHRPPASREPGH